MLLLDLRNAPVHGASLADSVVMMRDTSSLNLRSFPAEKLNTYRTDRDFQYGTDVRPYTSAWDRFWRMVREYIGDVLRSRSYDGFWKYILYALVISLMFFCSA